MKVKFLSAEKSLFFLIPFLLCIYLVFRAILVPMGHDEVATFYYYVQTGSFLPFQFHNDANNHILNSFLTWIFYSLFGPSPFALRLANLLFAPLFFYFSYKLSTLVKDSFLRYSFFITLCLCHNFIEFFALSRGYGISMALLMGALWYLIRYAGESRIRNLLYCLVMTDLAVLANLTLINTLILVIAFLFFFTFRNKDFPVKKKLLSVAYSLAFGIIPLVIFVMILFRLRSGGDLYGGSELGFWRSTVKSLISLLFSPGTPAAGYIVLCIFILCLLLLVLSFLKKRYISVIRQSRTIFCFLLIGNIAATIAIAKLLHINYPEDRMGLYFYPLLAGSFIFLLDERMVLSKKIISLVLALPLILIPVHFLSHLNVTYASCSVSDNIPLRFYDKVEAAWIPGNLPPTIGSEHQGHFCWSWLAYRHGGNLSQEFWSEYPSTITDFIIAGPAAKEKVNGQYDSIDFNNVSGKYLLKRKHPVKMELLLSRSGIATPGMITKEFFTLSEGPADSLAGKSLYLGYDLNIASDENPLMAWIVTSVRDKDGKEIRYEYISLEWLRNQWKGGQGRFINGMLVYSLPQNSYSYDTYLWNERKSPLRIEKGSVNIYMVK